jgi:hypothetical protein
MFKVQVSSFTIKMQVVIEVFYMKMIVIPDVIVFIFGIDPRFSIDLLIH